MSFLDSTAKINIVNNSGRSLDSVVIYHSPIEPQITFPTLEAAGATAAISVKNLASGATSETASVTTSAGDPQDFWLGGVLFEGDGETYIICGDLGSPYKEYEVSDGDTLTITIPKYEENSSNQGDASFSDGGGSQTAYLLNHTTADLIAFGKLVVDIVRVVVAASR